MDCIEQIFALFVKRGHAEYFGECVSQTQHALQVAYFAAQEQAQESLVAAALLHDLGHLLAGEEGMAERGIDGHHEDAADIWLKRYFTPAVTEPIRMHVEAKRYLCYADPAYLAGLSPASLLSLKLQGGAFNEREAGEFERRHHATEAVRLRRWDDRGKIPDLAVPGLVSYRELLMRQVVRDS